VSETERDSGWSEQYAETGGWPPPAEDQRSYGPGAPPDDPSASADEPTQRTGPADAAGQWSDRPCQWAPTNGNARPEQPNDQAADGDDAPGPWGQSADPTVGRREPNDQAAGEYGQLGRWEDPAGQWGQPGPGYAQPAQPAGGPGQWGYPGDRAGQWERPADQGEPGAYGQPDQAWAPGDSAYGRLGRQTPPPAPQQRPRRPWEGRPAPARRPGGTPVVTITLIAICVVFYLLQQANPAFTARYALIPFDVQHGQYARLITSAFLHASLLHLGTNMITLYIVGAPLERVLRPVRYLIVYFLSALGGSLFSVWLSPEFSIGVGASGAIFGLFGALVVLRRQVGAEAGGLAALIGLNLVISFTVPNISWQAHIGGLITGVLVALALRGIDGVSRRRPAG